MSSRVPSQGRGSTHSGALYSIRWSLHTTFGYSMLNENTWLISVVTCMYYTSAH